MRVKKVHFAVVIRGLKLSAVLFSLFLDLVSLYCKR